jgi:predicted amidohydrolase
VTPEFAIGGLSHTAESAGKRALGNPMQLLAHAGDAPAELTVILGYTERTRSGLHSSAAVLRNGTLVTTVRKAYPREPGLVPAPARAVGRSTFDVAGVRCGILICADARHPELAAGLAAEGAELLICPLNNDMSLANAARWRLPTEEALAARARETGCWVVSADVAGQQAGRSALAATRVVAPDGSERARSEPLPDELVVFDLLINR